MAEWFVGHNIMEMSQFMLLAFDVYGRPGEIINLKTENICTPSTAFRNWAICFGVQELGEFTKTNTQDDTVVVGLGHRKWMCQILEKLYVEADGRADKKLFAMTLREAERLFKKCTKSLNLQALQLTPHCLRHGGASHDSLAGIGLSAIMVRGRWKQLDSARRYAKHGRIAKQIEKLSPRQQQMAVYAAGRIRCTMKTSLRAASQSLRFGVLE